MIPTPLCPCCGQDMPERFDVNALIAHLRLTKWQRRIVECLAKRFGQDVDRQRVVDAAYFDCADGGPENDGLAIRILSCSARKILRPAGLTIVGRGGGRAGGGTLRLAALP